MLKFARNVLLSALVAATGFSIGVSAFASDTINTTTSHTPPIWDSTSTLDVRLEGALKTLLSSQNTNLKTKVPGQLSYEDQKGQEHRLGVLIEVRGKSSRKDCPFPKLELKFTGPTTNTLFTHTKKIKIGTHCGEQEGWSNDTGRLKNQISPHREALLYRILETLGLPTFKTRPARVTYVFTDDSNQTLLRNAIFLETTGAFEKRTEAKEIFTATQDPKAFTHFRFASEFSDMNEVALVYLANTMLSNSDFIIPIDEAQAKTLPLWNTKAFVRADGSRFLVPYDFDLAYFVTSPESTFNIEFLLEDTKTRALAGFPEELAHAKQTILAKRAAIEQVVNQTDLSFPAPVTGKLQSDSNGKSAILNYLKEMFKEVEAL